MFRIFFHRKIEIEGLERKKEKTTNNMSAVRTTRKYVNVADAKEIVEFIHHFQNLLDENTDKMNEGLYIELCDALVNLYCNEFYVDLEIMSGGTSRAGAGKRQPLDAIRRLARERPDKAIVCPRCNTPLMIRSFEKHLRTTKCKDFYYALNSGGVVLDADSLNELIIEKYETNENLPEVEVLPEHQFPIGGASGLD